MTRIVKFQRESDPERAYDNIGPIFLQLPRGYRERDTPLDSWKNRVIMKKSGDSNPE
jgi:hypothetical protein